MVSLYLQGISISEIEALVKKAVKEVLSEQSLKEYPSEQLSKNHNKLPLETSYLSRKEVSQLLKVSLVTLNNWTKLGKLTPYKAGKRVLYKKEEVEEFLAKTNPKVY